QPELDEEAGGREDDEEIVLLEDAREAAQHDEAEDQHDDDAGHEAELLAGDGEDEIGMGVGQELLDRAFAWASAPQPAIHESLDRAVDLIAVAARRIEKAVDAAGDVRQEGIGADQPDHAAGEADGDPVEAQPGE